MKIRLVFSLCFLSLATCLMGCGGDKKLYPVEGVVTLDGDPLEGATVTFTREGATASGLTSASGKFKLLTAGQEGVPEGTYKVTVTKLAKATATIDPGSDPTKAYSDMLAKSGAKPGRTGGLEIPKPKSDVPERYSTPGALPDQIVPISGSMEIELSSKK